MEKWIARDWRGIFLYEEEPQPVYRDTDTSSGNVMPKYEFDVWTSKKNKMELHPNTYKSVKIGEKRKCKVKIQLI